MDRQVSPKILQTLSKKFASPIAYHKISKGSESLCFVCPLEIILENGLVKKLFLKTFPSSVGAQEFVQNLNIFYKELCVYKIWIGQLEKYFKNQIRLPFARFYCGQAVDYRNKDAHYSTTNNNFFLLEDLRYAKNGPFTEAKYLGGKKILDFDHTTKVILQMAKLHATSWIYKQKYGIKSYKDKFSFFSDQIYPGGNNQMLKEGLKWRFGQNFEILKFILNQNGYCEESKVYKAVSNLEIGAAEYVLDYPKENDTKPDSWNLLCHGDLMFNNILFRYNDLKEKPIDCIFVDLQFMGESCPTTDLVYFIYTSTDSQFRQKYLTKLLNLYYSEFVKICLKFKIDPPPKFTLDKLAEKFAQTKKYGFYIALCLLPVLHPVQTELKNKNEILSQMLLDLVQEFFTEEMYIIP